MNKYFQGIIVITVIITANLIFRYGYFSSNYFPLPKQIKKRDFNSAPFIILFFFSKGNCLKCLSITKDLNRIAKNIPVFGIIPESESEYLNQLDSSKTVNFPIFKFEDFNRITPLQIPSMVGVSPEGRTIFILPIIKGECKQMERFVNTLYNKLRLQL